MICFVGLTVLTAIGCGSGDRDVVVPSKPPLTADAAMEKTKKQQQEKIKSMQDQAKRKAKK